MKQLILFVLASITLLIFSACSGTTSLSETGTAAVAQTLTPEPTLNSTPIPTSIPTLTPSSTPVPLQKLSRTCVTADKTNKTGITLQGVVVLGKLAASAEQIIFLRNIEKPNIKVLSSPGVFGLFWDVSPDRKKLLFDYDSLAKGEGRIAITDANGKILLDFNNQINGNSWRYYNWQNDENIRTVRTDSDTSQVFPGLYNPFTKEYKILRTDWSDVYVSNGLDWKLDWVAISTMYYYGANIVYDPTATRVVYPKNGEIVSLTDVETSKELASIHLPHWGKLPRWSLDGKSLVLVASAKTDSTEASDEFFIVSKDGSEFKQLTHLTNAFDQVAISEYAWSPDGKKLAFLLDTASGNPTAEGRQAELAILDVDTNEITNLCFQAISTVTSVGGPELFASIQPVWSPDGTQIMVAQWDADSSDKKRKYSDWIIDIPSLTAVKIDENKQPAGWMINIP